MKTQLLFLLKNSLDDLKKNKGRTFLTSLGILIGVFSVVLLIAFGLGLKNYINDQFQSLGTDLVTVMPGKILSGGSFRGSSGGFGAKFTEKDVLNLGRIKEAEYVVPAFTKTVTVSGLGKTEISDLYATSADIFPSRNLEIDKGVLFTSADVRNRTKETVIGSKLAEKLFGNADNAIGKSIRIENQGFSVVGILKKKGGGFGGPDIDNFTYIPYTSALSFNPDKKFLVLIVKAKSKSEVPVLKSAVNEILLKTYKEDDFSVIEPTEILAAVNSIFGMVNLVLVAIGSISLLVGGVGIMNIMYATVTERTKEIGIRRAIGATRRNILLQFLSESIILSLFGGLGGLLLAALATAAIHPFFPASLDATSIISTLLISSIIGVFFGVFPANKAAKLSPIEAIRYE